MLNIKRNAITQKVKGLYSKHVQIYNVKHKQPYKNRYFEKQYQYYY